MPVGFRLYHSVPITVMGRKEKTPLSFLLINTSFIENGPPLWLTNRSFRSFSHDGRSPFFPTIFHFLVRQLFPGKNFFFYSLLPHRLSFSSFWALIRTPCLLTRFVNLLVSPFSPPADIGPGGTFARRCYISIVQSLFPAHVSPLRLFKWIELSNCNFNTPAAANHFGTPSPPPLNNHLPRRLLWFCKNTTDSASIFYSL